MASLIDSSCYLAGGGGESWHRVEQIQSDPTRKMERNDVTFWGQRVLGQSPILGPRPRGHRAPRQRMGPGEGQMLAQRTQHVGAEESEGMVLGAAMANKRLSINEAYNKVRRKQYLQPVCHAPNIIIAPSPPLSSVPLDIRLATAAAVGMRAPSRSPIRRRGDRTTRDETRTNNSSLDASMIGSSRAASLIIVVPSICPSVRSSGCGWRFDGRGFPGAHSRGVKSISRYSNSLA